MASTKLAAAAVFLAGATALVVRRTEQREPAAGVPEPTKEAACGECALHAPYIKANGEDCVCFATDMHGTFTDDATKELTTREGYGFKTENTGKARVEEGWMWHCRPITASKGVWKQC